MAESYILEAQPRTLVGKKVGQLRRQGIVPISVYGPNQEPINLQVSHRPLQLALLSAGGTSLIDLKVASKTHIVLAREVQRDIIRGDITHVDFFAVDETHTIRASVPLQFVGESPLVTARLGILLTGATNVMVETLPRDLIQHIEVDLSVLKTFTDAIHARDLKLGATAEVVSDPDELIARITQTGAARSEIEEEEGIDVSPEVEVIAKGKTEEEDF